MTKARRQPSNLRIAIDCDGVLANFNKEFVSLVNKIWPGRLPRDYVPQSWFYEEVGLTSADFNRVWEDITATENFWLHLQPYADCVGDFAKFLYAYHLPVDLYIVTARTDTIGETVAKQTELWLQCCGLKPLTHQYLGVIVASDKLSVYDAAQIQFSIDDRGSTVEELDSGLMGKHKACLLDRPWNQDARPSHRVKSLSEFFSVAVGQIRVWGEGE